MRQNTFHNLPIETFSSRQKVATNNSSKSTKPAARFLIHFLAGTIVAGSVFLSGVFKRGGAKDIDARYFYVAAKCWAAGQSPYQSTRYDASFRAAFGSPPEALFVAYPPTLIPIVLPMAPFDWPVAAALFSCMNFGAAMALYCACYRMVRESVGTPLRLGHWLWVVMASTIGGIGGTIFTGQSSVFITAACALAIVGCRLGRMWLTVIGLVLATAKPHLSGPLILFVLLFEPRQRRALAIVAGVVAILVAYAAMVDSNLLHSYLDSIHTYNTLSQNDPAKQLGAVSLFLQFGIPLAAAQWLGILCLIIVLVLTACILKYSRESLTQVPIALMLLTFSTGLARGIQGYDVCCYAMGIALAATLNFRFRCALLIPALLVWRPGLLDKFGMVISGNHVASFAWLGLLTGTVIIAVLQFRSYWINRSSTFVAEELLGHS